MLAKISPEFFEQILLSSYTMGHYSNYRIFSTSEFLYKTEV